MKHARTLLQTLIPLVLVLSLVLPLSVGQTSLASEASSACSVTRSHTTSASERYNVPATCFADAGWAIPVPASADGNLETSTNYDYDSPIYLSNHGFRHGGVDWVGPLHSPYDTSTPVRAIGDGTIRHVVRDDDPTTNNSRLHIEHTAGNGAKFLAIYGHTYALSSFSVGGTVYHGQQIGTLRQSGSPIHLHFELNTILTTTSYGGVKDGTVNPLQFLIDNPGSGSTIDLALVSCYSQKFPFIYLTIRASSNGQPVSDLTKDDFSVTEDGRLQTDMFDVVPPQEGGGVRMADIVFLIDNSGSMSYEINAVKNNCEAFAEALVASDIDYRLGLVQFGQSANGGNPRIIGGGLTGSVSEFKSWVATMPADGSYEPGFAAIRLAIQSYSFRPGSQKVFILITDEDSDCRDKQTTIDMILANDVTVHVAALCSSGTSQADYCGPGSVRDVSGGLLFPVTGDYRSILDTIGEALANTYIVRYRTDNPALDGTVRTVVCTAQKGTASDFVQCTYIAGGAPHIQRTEETLALHNQSLVANSSPTISVLVTDAAEPFVQSVTLFVRTAGSGKAYGQIAMLPQGNDIYSADVPGSYVQSPGVDYYIKATDGQATSWDPSTDPDRNPYKLAVLPNDAPVIVHAPPGCWQPGNDVSLTVSASDSTYSITRFDACYRRQGDLLWQSMSRVYDSTTTSINLVVQLPAATWSTTALEYYIKVTDDLGVYRLWPEGGADAPFVLTSCDTGILLIPSEEDSLPVWGPIGRRVEHVVALNVERAIDERKPFQEKLDDIAGQGGLAIVAHPWASTVTLLDMIWTTSLTAIELYNANTIGKDAGGIWNSVNNARVGGNREPVWGIAVDDAHEFDDIGKTWVMVRAPELKKDAVLQALRDGSFYAVKGPISISDVIKDIFVSADGKTISVTMNDGIEGGYKAKFVRPNARDIEVKEKLKTYTYEVQWNDMWVRVEIDFDNGAKVWIQPFVCYWGKVANNPYQTTGSWYKAQLHCHTTRSDGALTPEKVVQEYSSLGYHILAITDHNRITDVSSDPEMYISLWWGEQLAGAMVVEVEVRGRDQQIDPAYPENYHVKDVLVQGYWKDLGSEEVALTGYLLETGIERFVIGIGDGYAHFFRAVSPLRWRTQTYTFVVTKISKPGWAWDGKGAEITVSVPGFRR